MKFSARPRVNPPRPTLPRLANHHTLVQKAVAGIQTEHITTGGQLGKPSSARRRVYERLKDYAAQGEGQPLRHQTAPSGH